MTVAATAPEPAASTPQTCWQLQMLVLESDHLLDWFSERQFS